MKYVTGIKETQRGLSARQKMVRRNALRALLKGGFRIQRESQKMVPVQFGNLKASAFTHWTKGVLPGNVKTQAAPSFTGEQAGELTAGHGMATSEASQEVLDGLKVVIAYSAYYAIFVHENLEAKHGPSREPIPGGPGQQAKFLENPFNSLKGSIMAEVARVVKLGAEGTKI